MEIPVKEILEQFCADYQKMLQRKNPQSFPRECVFETNTVLTNMTDEHEKLYKGKAQIRIDDLPVYVEYCLNKDPETAINNAALRLFYNLLCYGLGAAHTDLKIALNGERPFSFDINFE